MAKITPIWKDYYLFDAHSHISDNAYQLDRAFSPTEYLAWMKKYSVNAAAVCKVTRDSFRDNEEVAAFAKKASNIAPVAHINPHLEDATKEVQQRARAGFRGYKMHPDLDCFDAFDLKFLEPVLSEIAKFRLPILFHTGTPPHVTPVHIGVLAQHYPEIPMICGHAGLADSTFECITAGKMAENVYFDTALASTPPVIENLVKEVGPHRVMWGTDVPFGNFISQFFWVYSLNLTEREREQVFGLAARRLFTGK